VIEGVFGEGACESALPGMETIGSI
jgi:hypothetical protein